MLHSPLDFITDTQFGVLRGSFQLGSFLTFHHLVLPRSLTSLCLPGILCLKAFWMKLPERRVRRKYSLPVSLPVRPPQAGFIPDVTRTCPHPGPVSPLSALRVQSCLWSSLRALFPCLHLCGQEVLEPFSTECATSSLGPDGHIYQLIWKCSLEIIHLAVITRLAVFPTSVTNDPLPRQYCSTK